MPRERFGRLRFRVDKLKPGESIDVKFPALCDNQEYRTYSGHKRDGLIKYICFLYDPGSDLVDEFESLADRKDAAATEAGFKRNNNGDWTSQVKGFMDLSDDQARAMILRFLKIIHHHIWTEMCILEQELEVYNKMRLEPLPTDSKRDNAELLAKRDNLMVMCEKRVKALEMHKMNFYGDNEDLKELTEEQLITPENAYEVMKISLN
jgi:hypothetical protein